MQHVDDAFLEAPTLPVENGRQTLRFQPGGIFYEEMRRVLVDISRIELVDLVGDFAVSDVHSKTQSPHMDRVRVASFANRVQTDVVDVYRRFSFFSQSF